MQKTSASQKKALLLMGMIMIGGNAKKIANYQQKNCNIYAADGSCEKCSYRYWMTEEGQCNHVSDHCKTWGEHNGHCTSCYHGYSVHNGECMMGDQVAVSVENSVEPNYQCGSQGQQNEEKSCECHDEASYSEITSYHSGELNSCQGCKKHHWCPQWTEGDHCAKYEYVNKVNNEKHKSWFLGCEKVCTECKPYYYLNCQNKCTPNPDKCMIADTDGKCMYCHKGLEPNQKGVCIKIKDPIKHCLQYKYIDTAGKHYLSWFNGCTRICTKCKPGYKWSLNTKTCARVNNIWRHQSPSKAKPWSVESRASNKKVSPGSKKSCNKSTDSYKSCHSPISKKSCHSSIAKKSYHSPISKKSCHSSITKKSYHSPISKKSCHSSIAKKSYHSPISKKSCHSSIAKKSYHSPISKKSCHSSIAKKSYHSPISKKSYSKKSKQSYKSYGHEVGSHIIKDTVISTQDSGRISAHQNQRQSKSKGKSQTLITRENNSGRIVAHSVGKKQENSNLLQSNINSHGYGTRKPEISNSRSIINVQQEIPIARETFVKKSTEKIHTQVLNHLKRESLAHSDNGGKSQTKIHGNKYTVGLSYQKTPDSTVHGKAPHIKEKKISESASFRSNLFSDMETEKKESKITLNRVPLVVSDPTISKIQEKGKDDKTMVSTHGKQKK